MRFLDKINTEKKGFSLLEVLIAVLIFSLVMSSVVGIFGKMIKAYRLNRVIQRDMEAAQFSVSLLAKTLRSSVPIWCNASLCSASASGNYSSLRVYDYSQGRCLEYQIDTANKKLTQALPTTPPPSNASNAALKTWCKTATMVSPAEELIADVAGGSFFLYRSSTSQAGKVTVTLKLCPGGDCGGTVQDEAILQSSVSLRNYRDLSPT